MHRQQQLIVDDYSNDCTLCFSRKQYLLSLTKPSTCTIAIFVTFKYLGKTWDNNCDASIIHHICVRGLITIRLALLNAKTMTSTTP
jgi:Na+/glutamate symporter